MRSERLAASFALVLAACATPAGEDDHTGATAPDIDLVLDQLTGGFDNSAQYEAAPDALKRPPAPGHPYDWLDLQSADFFTVEAPQIGEHVVYLEWRSGGAGGEISRQRIWSFLADESGRATGMDFFTFRTPERFAGRGDEAGAFTALTSDDLIGYPEGCTLQARRPAGLGWVFEVNAEDCRITARSGRVMGIQARIDLITGPGERLITYAEAGVLEDGAYAFKVPGGPAYRFAPR